MPAQGWIDPGLTCDAITLENAYAIGGERVALEDWVAAPPVRTPRAQAAVGRRAPT